MVILPFWLQSYGPPAPIIFWVCTSTRPKATTDHPSHLQFFSVDHHPLFSLLFLPFIRGPSSFFCDHFPWTITTPLRCLVFRHFPQTNRFNKGVNSKKLQWLWFFSVGLQFGIRVDMMGIMGTIYIYWGSNVYGKIHMGSCKRSDLRDLIKHFFPALHQHTGKNELWLIKCYSRFDIFTDIAPSKLNTESKSCSPPVLFPMKNTDPYCAHICLAAISSQYSPNLKCFVKGI